MKCFIKNLFNKLNLDFLKEDKCCDSFNSNPSEQKSNQNQVVEPSKITSPKSTADTESKANGPLATHMQIARENFFEQTLLKKHPRIKSSKKKEQEIFRECLSIEHRIKKLEQTVDTIEEKIHALEVSSLPGDYNKYIIPGFLFQKVIVQTCGKVGTTSISHTLRGIGVEHKEEHVFTQNLLIEAYYKHWGNRCNLHMLWAKYYMDLYGPEFSRQLKIITAIREPISRFLSFLFFGDYYCDNIVQKDLFQGQVLSVDIIINKIQKILSYCPQVDQSAPSIDHLPVEARYSYFVLTPITWYKGMMSSGGILSHLKIDTENSPLHDVPYNIIDRTLLLKFEYIDKYAEGIKRFLDVRNDFSLDKANASSQRNDKFSSFYREVAANLSVNKNILDFLYGDPIMKMFYSPGEIERFYKKWNA